MNAVIALTFADRRATATAVALGPVDTDGVAAARRFVAAASATDRYAATLEIAAQGYPVRDRADYLYYLTVHLLYLHYSAAVRAALDRFASPATTC